jgi:hypothetical protein
MAEGEDYAPTGRASGREKLAEWEIATAATGPTASSMVANAGIRDGPEAEERVVLGSRAFRAPADGPAEAETKAEPPAETKAEPPDAPSGLVVVPPEKPKTPGQCRSNGARAQPTSSSRSPAAGRS